MSTEQMYIDGLRLSGRNVVYRMKELGGNEWKFYAGRLNHISTRSDGVPVFEVIASSTNDHLPGVEPHAGEDGAAFTFPFPGFVYSGVWASEVYVKEVARKYVTKQVDEKSALAEENSRVHAENDRMHAELDRMRIQIDEMQRNMSDVNMRPEVEVNMRPEAEVNMRPQADYNFRTEHQTCPPIPGGYHHLNSSDFSNVPYHMAAQSEVLMQMAAMMREQSRPKGSDKDDLALEPNFATDAKQFVQWRGIIGNPADPHATDNLIRDLYAKYVSAATASSLFQSSQLNRDWEMLKDGIISVRDFVSFGYYRWYDMPAYTRNLNRMYRRLIFSSNEFKKLHNTPRSGKGGQVQRYTSSREGTCLAQFHIHSNLKSYSQQLPYLQSKPYLCKSANLQT